MPWLPWTFLLCLAVPALADRFHHAAAAVAAARKVSEPTLVPTSTLPQSPDIGSLQPSSTQDPLWPEPPKKPVTKKKVGARFGSTVSEKESSATAKRSAKKAKAKLPHMSDWAHAFQTMGGAMGYW